MLRAHQILGQLLLEGDDAGGVALEERERARKVVNQRLVHSAARAEESVRLERVHDAGVLEEGDQVIHLASVVARAARKYKGKMCSKFRLYNI